MAFPFVPVGIGAAALLGLGLILMRKSTPQPPPPAPTQKKETKAIVTSAPAMKIPPPEVPYGTSPGYVPSSDLLKGTAAGRAVGARYGAADRDAGAADDSLNVREIPSGSDDFTSGFRLGFVAGYNAEYWKSVPGKKPGAAPPTAKAVTKDWRVEGYTGGFAQGSADAAAGLGPNPSDVSRVPAGYRGPPDTTDPAAIEGWRSGYASGYGDGYKSVSSAPIAKTSTDSSSDDSESSSDSSSDGTTETSGVDDVAVGLLIAIKSARQPGEWGTRNTALSDVKHVRARARVRTRGPYGPGPAFWMF